MEQNLQNKQNLECGVEACQLAASVGKPVGEPTIAKR